MDKNRKTKKRKNRNIYILHAFERTVKNRENYPLLYDVRNK